MNKLDKWYQKNKGKAEYAVLFFILGYLGSKSLDWIFSNLFTSDNAQTLKKDLNTKIPISFLVIGVLLTTIVVRVLAAIKLRRSELKIINAKYGADGGWVDITAELNELVSDNKLMALISNDIAGDPLMGTRKAATIHYLWNRKKGNINVNEGEVLKLPEPVVVTSR
jgi:hypothetical protein